MTKIEVEGRTKYKGGASLVLFGKQLNRRIERMVIRMTIVRKHAVSRSY